MFAPITRRHFLRGALTAVAATACLLPAAAPAVAAKQPNPDSPKGTFRGTYTSTMTEGLTGSLTVKVTKDGKVRGTNQLRKLTAYLTLDQQVKNKKALGGYSVQDRVVTLGTPVRSGFALSVVGILSEDGQSIRDGLYFLSRVGRGGGIVDQGTFEELTRQ